MDRRKFLEQLGYAGLAAGNLSSFALASENTDFGLSAKKPNVLVIMTDQQHAGAASSLGNPYVNTPCLDTLLESSCSFENAYCTNPVCMPSRASFFTGMMPTEAGVWINTAHQDSGGRFDRNLPSLGKWFRDQGGYETVYAGKYHLPQSDTFNVLGFDVIASSFEHRGSPGDSTVSRACEAFVRNRDVKSEEKPFLMVCSLVNPHDVCHWLSINTDHANRNERYPDLETVASLPPLPDNFDIENLGECASQIADRLKRQPFSGNWESEDWRYYLWAYFRQVEMVDAEIGRVLNALNETGLDRDTIVIFTSDHGEGLGEHQMVRKGFLYESAARVPFSIRYPGEIAPRRDEKTLVSVMDIFPTLCDLSKIQKPDSLTHARNLGPLLKKTEASIDRDYLVIEDNSPCRINKDILSGKQLLAGRAVRSNHYKYINYDGYSEEQLFDMVLDRGETCNLAREEKFETVVKEHRDKLRMWEAGLKISPNVPASAFVETASL